MNQKILSMTVLLALTTGYAHTVGIFTRTNFESETVGSVSSILKVISGTWTVSEHPTPNKKTNRAIEQRSQEKIAIALYAKPLPEEGFMASCRVMLLGDSPKSSIGMVFNYADENNYSRVTISAEEKMLRLEKMARGNSKILKEVSIEFKPETWYSIRMKSRADLFAVDINEFEALRMQSPALASQGNLGFLTLDGARALFDNLAVVGLEK